MCTEIDTKVIDPEFAFYGPMGFDLGALIANLIMNYLSQDGHEKSKGDRLDYKEWILQIIDETWNKFEIKFIELWKSNQKGDAYTINFFENDKEKFLTEQKKYLSYLFNDSIGFAGAKIIRRIFGFAHNIDFDWIEEDKKRAVCEIKSAILGIEMVLNAKSFTKIETLTSRLKIFDKHKIDF